jgi:hypothetical protein
MKPSALSGCPAFRVRCSGPLQQSSTGLIAGTRRLRNLAYFDGTMFVWKWPFPIFLWPSKRWRGRVPPPKAVWSEWRIAETLKVGEVSAVWQHG